MRGVLKIRVTNGALPYPSSMIVGGTRMCGRVDETRSGHVVTRFFHIWFVPLVPLSSWFVAASGSVVKIPLSLRSIFAAYVRAFGVLLALGCVAGLIYILAFGFFSDLEIYMNGGNAVTEEEIVQSVAFMAVLGVGALAGVVLYFLTRFFRKANSARCGELARQVGMPVAPL
jgi:hypothetical protein